MAFINQELPKICNSLITCSLEDDISSIVSFSNAPNLRITIKTKTNDYPEEVEVCISNIVSKIFKSPNKSSDPLYKFSGKITYNPKTDKCIFTNDLIFDGILSAIFRLAAKVLSFLAEIFRFKTLFN
jgi:hypothetical protein